MINKRVRQLRKYLKMSQEEFGEKLGLAKSGISNIENGARNLTERNIKLVCSEFNVDEHWLRTGEGGDDVIFVENDSAIVAELANEYKLDAVDIKIIEHYIKLPDEDRKKIKNYIVDLAAQINSVDEPSLLDITQDISATTDVEVAETDEERAEREGEAIKQKHIKETLLEQKIKTS